MAVSADLSYLINDGAVKAAAGVEYTYASSVSARVGYAYEEGAVTGLTAGAGIKLEVGFGTIKFDYAFLPAFLSSGLFEAENIITLGLALR